MIASVIENRRKLGWNIQLPALGIGAKNAMLNYVHRFDSEVRKSKDDDGSYIYALCLSDLKTNAAYSPYSLRVCEKSMISNYSVYYTATATNIVRVNY